MGRGGDSLRAFGILLLICGVAGMVATFFFSVTVTPDALASQASILDTIRGMNEDEARSALISHYSAGVTPIANLNLIAIRAMLHASAATVATVGALLFGAACRATIRMRVARQSG